MFELFIQKRYFFGFSIYLIVIFFLLLIFLRKKEKYLKENENILYNSNNYIYCIDFSE